MGYDEGIWVKAFNPFKTSYSLEKSVGQLSEEWTLVHTRMTAYLVIQKIIMMK